ncbi:MAG: aquaporin [Chloroflexi bacterium]|nr:aquaporin [Chloroflexota bacterium]
MWAAALAEFLGPFTLVVAGVGAIISTQNLSDGGNLVAVALAHGLAIGLMIAALGHISGGHFNPAVTISMLATGEIGVTRAASYIVAQVLGATAGAGVLTLIFPALGPMGRNNPGVNLGLPGLGPDVSVSGALIMEVLMTFFLVLVIFGTVVDPRGSRAIAPLAIGLIITMDILTGGRITGAAMNPARAIGPAFVQQDFTNWWVYWVGPIIGGLIAALAYKAIWLNGGGVALSPARRGTPTAARHTAPAVDVPVEPPQPSQPPRRRSSRRR